MYPLNVLTNQYDCYFNVGMGDYRCIVWEHPQKVSLMISVQKGVLSKIADNTLYILFKI